MAVDIFEQFSQLFRNQTPEGDMQVFVMHRFFASDPAFAPFAKELAPLYDDKMVVEIWRSAVPFMAKAPYFKYPAPRKAAAASEIIKKIAEVEGYTIVEAETAFLMLDQKGKAAEAYAFYGIEPVKGSGAVESDGIPLETPQEKPKRGGRKKKA